MRYGIRPRKSLGQNFLISGNVLDRIVAAAEIRSGDTVVEIGPGVGVLTRRLALAGARVIALELDRRLLPLLEETLADLSGVEVVQGDALEVDFRALLAERGLTGTFKVVANLPYYITSPLIARLLEEGHPFELAVVMVQREVAERLVAGPGTKAYGAFSVLVQYYTQPASVLRVSRRNFSPPPEVDSTVILMRRLKEPRVKVNSAPAFFAVVRGAFGQRRKMLPSALEGAGLGLDKRFWMQVCEIAGIDPKRRGETLSIGEFGQLADAYTKYHGNPFAGK
ncbi:MAG: 16S rRNA (adenine(1518)-N(6)/adenine(1519)-N(6))-dimethyltransferase RsmA [Eubacteriales bacterium]|nr:16S rRNA (adenine(1518)-N(6)/adenine(1519)-N(6))-dimethyltransferase RsmA [Bacillota bacterium]MDQ7789499.1 16S rRNA (adenine(1518)-N(6)/adenine(1519)-N(6))-dimethyltransferase RsmA [Clostridia bacterium]MDZ4042208.1 16S rRNA (adenine(1518)-N(6)/adenine(1519)-N(6))-dimethyltransferase RsmA [Eubacteriales bacterium]MDZ7609586.1 16S rRNA (adenine(1518)-N(6)/adenine(1519)-N(6))-dimethyltransferase RsmA [Eubacteriales bacterium]